MVDFRRSKIADAAPDRRPGRPPGSRNRISKAQIERALENGDSSVNGGRPVETK
jgi:hypothetical protein